MTDDRHDALERLSAYLAGDLDADEAAAVSREVADDPRLQDLVARLEATDEALRRLERPEPSATFSSHLRARLEEETASGPDDELAARRREARWSPLRTLGVAAAAAAVIVVVGVGAGIALRGAGGGDTAGEPMAAQEAATGSYEPTVPVLATDNDYDDLTLRRLAVNVDTQFIVPPDLRREGAADLEGRLVSQIAGGSLPVQDAADGSALSGEAAPEADGPAADVEPDARSDAGAAADTGQAPDSEEVHAVAARCLPEILGETDSPLVPVYVELATYEDQPAIVFTFAAENPESGLYDRIEVWAMARDDCHTFQFAQYDRSGP